MKKFFVGLLSIFMLLGGAILSACGSSAPELKIYHNGAEVTETLSIEKNSSDPDSGYILLSAELQGVNGDITASTAGGYEDNLTVAETAENSNIFKVTGLTETENGPAAVVFRGTPGDVTKYVYINVYSYVSSMQQNSDEERNHYLVSGQSYTIDENGITAQDEVEGAKNSLSENELIKFSPSNKSMRQLAWEIQKDDGTFEAVTSFEVSGEYIISEADGKYVILKAIDQIGSEQECTIKLRVLDEIVSSYDYEWNYTGIVGAFADKTVEGTEDKPFEIISNIADHEHYLGYAWIAYTGKELVVTPKVSKKMMVKGKVEYVALASTKEEMDAQPDESLWLKNNLSILRKGTDPSDTYTYYAIKTTDSENVSDYKVHFEVGYGDFNYAGKTSTFYINMAEEVSEVRVSTKGHFQLVGDHTVITDPIPLYDSYATVANVSKEGLGQIFGVSLYPDVLDGSNKYYLSIDTREVLPFPDGQPITDKGEHSPIAVFSQNPNGSMLEGYEMVEDAANPGVWYFGKMGATGIEKRQIAATDVIYMLASNKLMHQTTNDAVLTFTSVDNERATTQVKLTLKKSASVKNFEEIKEVELDADGNIIKVTETDPVTGAEILVPQYAETTGKLVVDSSQRGKVYTKAFKLEGQSTIEELDAVYDEENLTISNWQILERSTEIGKEYVIFSFDVELKAVAYGKTIDVAYKIVHENGNQTIADMPDEFMFKIILPFSSITIFPDAGNNLSNSITDDRYNTATNDVEYLMLKNNTITPILYSMKEINGYVPEISAIDVMYVSFASIGAGKTLQDFLNFYYSNTDADRNLPALEMLAAANDSANVVTYSTSPDLDILQGQISTKNVGYAYILLTFTGRGADGEETSIKKVIFVESFNAPEGLRVPSADDREVEVYASDSVSKEYADTTYQVVDIKFENQNTTYNKEENVSISSRYGRLGNYYTISKTQIDGTGISFTVTGLTTDGLEEINDELVVEYSIKKPVDENKDGVTDQDADGNDLYKYVYKRETYISIKIKKAQRIESIVWKNADEDGLYFELGESGVDANTRYLILETSPTNAKDNSMRVVVAKDGEKEGDASFVYPTYGIAEDIIAINLRDGLTEGVSGYAYILPEDAIFGGEQIKYYYRIDEDGNMVKFGSAEFASATEQTATSIDIATVGENYDLLKDYAYFKSSEQTGNVSFANIILRIRIEVANGSEAHPYRIFSEEQFIEKLKADGEDKSLKVDLHYLIMNDLQFSGWKTITTFYGGIRGNSQDITITLDGGNLIGTINEGAYVKNITLRGNVKGNGFVANVNNGIIDGVVIDTNGKQASVVDAGDIGGGLVGKNNGTIKNSSVLGTEVQAAVTAGGAAGENYGTIENVRVEFYNLEVSAGVYASNKIKATNVGGIAGRMDGGSITKAYAYDYTLKAGSASVLVGTNKDPFVASHDSGIITDVFAVVGQRTTSATVSNYYLSYFDGATYTSTITNATPTASTNVVKNGEAGFQAYVNGGYGHFADFYQQRAITLNDIKKTTQTYKDTNGYYKSIQVDETYQTNGKGLLFYYEILADREELSPTELNDYEEINSITVQQLFNITSDAGIVVTSSKPQVLSVNGRTLQVRRSGDVTITLSSKQDASISSDISIKVINAISDLRLSRIESNGNEVVINDSAKINIQKTKTMDIVAAPQKSDVILGNLARRFDFVASEYELKSTPENTAANNEIFTIASGNIVRIEVEAQAETDFEQEIEAFPYIFEDTTYQKAISNAFTETFIARAADGLISFDISVEKLPLTPSSTAGLKVRLETTAQDDKIIPQIVLDGETSPLEVEETDAGEFTYTDVYGNNVLKAVRSAATIIKDTKPYIYEYYVTFVVHEDYRNKVSDNMTFNVYFTTTSKNSSLAWDGTFDIVLTRQDFTHIDTANMKITRTQILGGAEVYTAQEQTPVLAPGNAAVLKVNVNPEHAYYDYAEISYSGTSVVSAVNIEAVQEYTEEGKYTQIDEACGYTERVGTKLRFVPNPESENKSNLFFKLWINTTVDRDTILMFTVAFYKNGQEEKPLDFVNHYIKVSYLAEPTIKIDGQEVSYIAKGSVGEVKIEVLEDQVLESLVIAADTVAGVPTEVKGISLSSYDDGVIDSGRGTKVYTAKIACREDAFTSSKNRFYLQATVARELNGERETKTATATAVIVDFKIDDVSIENAEDGNLTIWQNVPKPLTINYNLLPESYVVTSENAALVSDLIASKNFFKNNHYYPKNRVGGESQPEYYINYKEKAGEWNTVPVMERLYVLQGGAEVPYESAKESLPFTITQTANGALQIKGTKANSETVTMILYTFIYAGGVESAIETRFNVNVETYSDPDLPIAIKDADDFKALDPQREGAAEDIKPQDYILENDIVLEDYKAFDTTAIRSLDGNGYTIYVKSFDMKDQSTLTLSLFNNVGEVPATETHEATVTTLKNLRVNYYNAGQIIVDVSRSSTIKIAGLAINNSGIITNCEVVSFYESQLAGDSLVGDEGAACQPHTGKTGFNVSYRNGANTSDEVFIAHNSGWSSQIAGFVLTNSGSITNSRVGGDEINLLRSTDTSGEKTLSELTDALAAKVADVKRLDTFHISGQGDIAGFVLSNNGTIASSFVKNIDIQNNSGATKFYTAGFVGKNGANARVMTSYIEGVETPANIADVSKGYYFARTGSSIRSTMGYIAGFTYQNEGDITDSYSNILIANSADLTKVYYASGFVYENAGNLTNCYSASQVANGNYSQMNFSGVRQSDGEPLNSGEYLNCYFFNADLFVEQVNDSNDTSTETQYNTGALLIKNPTLSSSFYGFAIASTSTEQDAHRDGVWKIAADGTGIKLVEPDYIATSHRYKAYQEEKDGEYMGPALTETIGDKTVKYTLAYAQIEFEFNVKQAIDTTLGGRHNPILIADAADWQEVFGDTKSSVIKQYIKDGYVYGVYRLVNDIDLKDLGKDLNSSKTIFSGAIYGNGFAISGISLSQTDSEDGDETQLSLGLLSSIRKRTAKADPALVINVDLQVEQIAAGNIPAVGGLAGIVRDASLINIEVTFGEDSVVAGLNYAGGLVGFAYGDNTIKNIRVENADVRAGVRTDEEDKFIRDLSTFRKSVYTSINYIRAGSADFSYAGAVAGYVDNFDASTRMTTAFSDTTDSKTATYSVNNIRVEGTVEVQALVVGGAFGLVGYSTNMNDVGVIVDATAGESKIASTRYFAGGIVGQSFGRITRAFAVHDDATQEAIEDGMGSFYTGRGSGERGILDLFDTSSLDSKNSQVAIGGLVGYVESGMLEISYSKLNVTAMSADYAGGIIGYIDVGEFIKTEAGEYKINSENIHGTSASSKYFINEVFATGDVRSKVMAGGLIGAIEGKGSNVALLAVNALNYFTTYNYETKQNDALVENQYQISSKLRLNSFVGSFLAQRDGGISPTTLTFESRRAAGRENSFVFQNGGGVLGDYIKLLAGKETVDMNGATQTSGTEAIPSVGRYSSYKFNGHQVYLSRFGEEMLVISETGKPDRYDVDREDKVDFDDVTKTGLNIYSITGPDQYSDSRAGRNFTQIAFLSSGVWSYSNWYHPMDDLFPSIKLQEIYNVVYLDVYNAAQIFTEMNGTDMVVIVRGLRAKGLDPTKSENLSDIKIYQSAENGKFFVDQLSGKEASDTENYKFSKITGFSGQIIGGLYPEGSDDKTKIVSHAGNFIASVAEGFGVSDQEFVYEKVEKRAAGESLELVDNGKANVNHALFVDGGIHGANISNLIISVNTNVVATATDGNYGIVASEITNSSIDGIAVKDIRSSATSGSLLHIEELDSETQTANVGGIAGKLYQSNVEEPMLVKNLSISAKNPDSDKRANFVSINGTIGTATLGAYFGIIDSETTDDTGAIVQPLYVHMAGLATGTRTMLSANGKITSLSMGGFAGTINHVSELVTPAGRDLSSTVEYILNSGAEVTELHAGNLTGTYRQGPSIVDGGDAVMRTIVDTSLAKKASHIYVGGVIGCHVQKTLTLQNFKKAIFNEVEGVDTIEATIQGAEGEDTFKPEGVETPVLAETVVGGFVGISRAQLAIRHSASTIEVDGQLNAKYAGGVTVVGSVVGATTAVAENPAETLSIAGDVSSSLDVTLGGNNVTFGGILGKVYSHSSSSARNNVKIGDGTNLVEYKGIATYKGSGTAVLGGIFGYFAVSAKDGNDFVTINKTSFAGQIEVKEAKDATVTIGGTVGQIREGTNTTITNSYNYGNAFVDYSSDNYFEKLEKYSFGGIVGVADAAEYNIQNNYSAVTSHNARYQTSNQNTAHAMFGEGTPTGTIANNYYNHGICLLTDNPVIATDIGYKTEYEGVRQGYAGDVSSDKVENQNIIYKIIDGLGKNSSDFAKGHKLNPMVIGSDVKPASIEGTTIEMYKGESFTDEGLKTYVYETGESYTDANSNKRYDAGVFFDLTYYTITEETTVENKVFSMRNAAFIGDGFKLNYRFNDMAYKDGNVALFRTPYVANMSNIIDHSFVSSIVEEVTIGGEEFVCQSDVNGITYTSLAYGFPANAMVYAANVYGTINVGGGADKKVHIAGLARNMKGKVFDCSTDIEIVSRTKSDSDLTNFVDMVGEGMTNVRPLVENCSTFGRVQTLSGNKIETFVSVLSGSYVLNSFCATTFDWRDYLTLKDYHGTTMEDEEKINSHSNGSTYSVRYDLNAANVDLYDSLNNTPSQFDYEHCQEDAYDLVGQYGWTKGEFAFNYGYPTLHYHYLKMSSYRTLSDAARACGHATCDQSTYDCYVENNTYLRVENGKKPANVTEAYYALLNASVLSQAYRIATENGFASGSQFGGNYVLLNDIDIQHTRFRTKDKNGYGNGGYFVIPPVPDKFPEGSDLSDKTFVGKFDGQGHTIDGLTKSLFAQVGTDENDAMVQNLRLTNVSIGDNAETTDGILANEIKNAVVRNITLSGNMTISKDDKDSMQIGSLAGIVNNAEIDAVTNTTCINITLKKEVADVGGVVGKIENITKLRYCSNYGTVNVTNTNHWKQASVGGIVGAMNQSEIHNSYNAAAVLNNYSNKDCDEERAAHPDNEDCLAHADCKSRKGRYFTGGIVGHADGGVYLTIGGTDSYNNIIEGCYNSGMIKSGNKLNVTAKDKDLTINAKNVGDVPGGSRAGGILAINANGEVATKIANCYNEGTVEALGKNAYYDVCVEGHSLTIKQVDKDPIGTEETIVKRNVVAYAIGPTDNISRKTNTYRLIQDIEGRPSVFANGAALPTDSEVISYDTSTEDDKWFTRYPYEMGNGAFYYKGNYGAYDTAAGTESYSIGLMVKYFHVEEENKYLKNEKSPGEYASANVYLPDKEKVITSRNSLNLPTSLRVMHDYVFDMEVKSTYHYRNKDTTKLHAGQYIVMAEEFIKGLNDMPTDESVGENNILTQYALLAACENGEISCGVPVGGTGYYQFREETGATPAILYGNSSERDEDNDVYTPTGETLQTTETLKEKISNTIKNVRSKKTAEDNTPVIISGESFYVADHNSSLFQKGVTDQEVTVVFESVVYKSDIDYEIVSLTDYLDKAFPYYNVISFNKVDGGDKLQATIRVYFTESNLDSGKLQVNATLKENYEQEGTISIKTGLKFYIIDENHIGMGIKGVSASSLQVAGVIDGVDAYECTNGSDTIYLTYNEKYGDFVYALNTKLNGTTEINDLSLAEIQNKTWTINKRTDPVSMPFTNGGYWQFILNPSGTIGAGVNPLLGEDILATRETLNEGFLSRGYYTDGCDVIAVDSEGNPVAYSLAAEESVWKDASGSKLNVDVVMLANANKMILVSSEMKEETLSQIQSTYLIELEDSQKTQWDAAATQEVQLYDADGTKIESSYVINEKTITITPNAGVTAVGANVKLVLDGTTTLEFASVNAVHTIELTEEQKNNYAIATIEDVNIEGHSLAGSTLTIDLVDTCNTIPNAVAMKYSVETEEIIASIAENGIIDWETTVYTLSADAHIKIVDASGTELAESSEFNGVVDVKEKINDLTWDNDPGLAMRYYTEGAYEIVYCKGEKLVSADSKKVSGIHLQSNGKSEYQLNYTLTPSSTTVGMSITIEEGVSYFEFNSAAVVETNENWLVCGDAKIPLKANYIFGNVTEVELQGLDPNTIYTTTVDITDKVFEITIGNYKSGALYNLTNDATQNAYYTKNAEGEKTYHVKSSDTVVDIVGGAGDRYEVSLAIYPTHIFAADEDNNNYQVTIRSKDFDEATADDGDLYGYRVEKKAGTKTVSALIWGAEKTITEKDEDGNDVEVVIPAQTSERVGEPFEDLDGNKAYDPGEPFDDLNGDGIWNEKIEGIFFEDAGLNLLYVGIQPDKFLLLDDIDNTRIEKVRESITIHLESFQKATLKKQYNNLNLNYELKNIENSDFYEKKDMGSEYEYTFYVRPDETIEPIKYVASADASNSAQKILEGVSAAEQSNIIIAKDLSLGLSDIGGTFKKKIIGNGFNVNYYGNSLYANLNNAKIKDLNILSERNLNARFNYSSFFLAEASTNSLLKGIKLFGSQGVGQAWDSYGWALGLECLLITTDGLSEGEIESYVSMDLAQVKHAVVNLIKDDDEETFLAANCGVYVIANGLDSFVSRNDGDLVYCNTREEGETVDYSDQILQRHGKKSVFCIGKEIKFSSAEGNKRSAVNVYPIEGWKMEENSTTEISDYDGGKNGSSEQDAPSELYEVYKPTLPKAEEDLGDNILPGSFVSSRKGFAIKNLGFITVPVTINLSAAYQYYRIGYYESGWNEFWGAESSSIAYRAVNWVYNHEPLMGNDGSDTNLENDLYWKEVKSGEDKDPADEPGGNTTERLAIGAVFHITHDKFREDYMSEFRYRTIFYKP